MAKILVVDDEADLETLVKQKFRQKIRENKYEFVFAANGKLARIFSRSCIRFSSLSDMAYVGAGPCPPKNGFQ